jgi:hypothetical protein
LAAFFEDAGANPWQLSPDLKTLPYELFGNQKYKKTHDALTNLCEKKAADSLGSSAGVTPFHERFL